MATTTQPDNPPAASRGLLSLWASLAAVLLVTLIGVTVAYLHASDAATQAQKTANCVNAILGARAPLTNADHANERQKIEDQIVAERDKSRGLTELAVAKNSAQARAGFEVYRKGVTEFIKALDDWKARDDAITAKKLLHPLGKC